MPKKEERPTRVAVRVSDDELRELREGCEHYGLDVSSYLRMLVRRDVRELRDERRRRENAPGPITWG